VRYTGDGVGANAAGTKTSKERGAMAGRSGGHGNLRKGAKGCRGKMSSGGTQWTGDSEWVMGRAIKGGGKYKFKAWRRGKILMKKCNVV
jgi:hypothetical protein